MERRLGRDDRVEVDFWALRQIRCWRHVVAGEHDRGRAVGDRVMQFRKESAASAFEAVDHDVLPQRPGSVERISYQFAGEIEEPG